MRNSFRMYNKYLDLSIDFLKLINSLPKSRVQIWTGPVLDPFRHFPTDRDRSNALKNMIDDFESNRLKASTLVFLQK